VTDVHLPTLNAFLNATCAVLLLAGRWQIARKRVEAHRACMVAALACSTLFLVFYLLHHARAGSTRFTADGWIRPVYFAVLISHTVLAAAVVPMVLATAWRALRGRFEAHARLARWTWPVWMYVSVTGIAVYWLLYRSPYRPL
jgi:uncharacterized membrane protein YozB (DUF420 family)